MPSSRHALAAIALALSFTGFAAAQTAAAPAASAAFHSNRFIVQVEGNPTGPDVILIPGLGSSRDVWKDEAAKLAPTYRLTLIQIRGFAGFPAGDNAKGPMLQPIVADLAQYIETGNLKQPAIIGHSMGGTLALMLAEQHPQDVGKVMLVDTLPFLGVLFDPKADVDLVKPQAQEARQQLVEMTTQDFLQMENGTIATMVKNPDKRKLVLFWTLNSDRHVLGNAFYDAAITDLRPGLAAVQTPITLLYPYDKDKQKQPDTDKIYQTAYAKAPHATLVRIDDSYHFIMLDQPQKFDEQVQKFLKS